MWKVFVQLFLLSSSESLRLARRQHTVRAQRDFDMYKYFSWFILHQFLCTGVFEFVCIYNLFMYLQLVLSKALFEQESAVKLPVSFNVTQSL